MYKIDLLRLLRRLGIVHLSVVCGNCVWSSWHDFDILRSPIASQRKCSVYLRGWVIFHLAACSILLFLSVFYKCLKRLVSDFLDWELVEGKKIQCHFFVISWQRWILETLKQVPMSYVPFCFHCYVVFKIASPWCLGACSLPQRPLRWHTWNPCSKGEDLGIEAVTGEPSIHAYPSFSTDAWSYTSTVLFYSCPEFLIKFKHQRHQRQDHDPSQHLSWFHLYFHLKMERLQPRRFRCLLVRCCAMGRAAVDQAVSSSTGEVVPATFTVHEGEPWLINDRGAGLKETWHDNWNFIQTKRYLVVNEIWESRILGPHGAWKPNKVLRHSAFSSHPVCMAKISSVSHGSLELVLKYSTVCRLRLQYDAWCLVPSPFHKPRCRGIRMALETLRQATGLVQPHGTPAKVPKLISFFGTLELRTTQVVIRGVHVLIEDKSRSIMKSQDVKIGHGVDRTTWFWAVKENKHRKDMKRSQQRNRKHSKTS